MMALRRASDLANRMVEPLVALLAAFFSVLLAVSVFSRYVFDISIVESAELTRIAFLWAVFLAASCVAKRRQHIRITVIVDLLPRDARVAIERIVDVLIAGFGATIVWFGAAMTLRMTATFLPTLQVSQAWLYGALPVSGALIVLHALAHLATPVVRLTLESEGRV